MQTAESLDEIPLERLEADLVELAGHLTAGTCRWLLLLGEFDRRQGWLTWGCHSAAHWLSWRCGVTQVTAREQVRVARRLGELPRVAAAFAAGELSYSKVRAIARVATAATEEDLVMVARHATAAQVERLAGSYARVLAAQGPDPRRHDRRFLGFHHDDDGFLVLFGRLPAEEGAVVARALEAAYEQIQADRRAMLADRAAGAEAARYGGDSAESHSPAQDLAEVPPGEAENPERATYADALVAVSEAALSSEGAWRPAPERCQVVLHVDASLLAGKEGSLCELEGVPVPAEAARRMSCDAGLVTMIEDGEGNPLYLGRKARTVSPALRRALQARDGGCRFPSCPHRRRLFAHHVVHWARGGTTSIDNVLFLCGHHHRLVHEGGYTVEGDPRQGLVFRRPDGREIPHAPPLPGGEAGEVPRRNRRLGLAIGPDTVTGHWCGDRLSVGYVVSLLLGTERSFRRRLSPAPIPYDSSTP